MRDIEGFLNRWGSADAQREPVRLLRSAHGNVNTVGLPGIHEADDLDPTHPQWHDAIEPGVRPLVEVVTQEWGMVTYDSCEGHRYTGLPMPPAERRVGILPRDRAEYAAIAAALCRAITTASATMPPLVKAIAGRSDLTCETTGMTTPVLDLALVPAVDHTWAEYFDAVDVATRAMGEALRGLRPAEDLGCPCPTPVAAATDPGEGSA